ncbi:MAG: hypothetical protein RIC24_14660 [Hyphomicrobiales bacterium]|jgi:uncharacterized phage infection (PIP) family protein YhgE
MRIRYAIIPVLAALALAACDDQNTDQAEAPELNEYDSPVPETPAPEDQIADAPPTDLTPAEQAVDAVEEAAGTLATLATEQLNEITNGQPIDEAASELASDAVNALSEQVNNAGEGLSRLAGDLAGVASETADTAQDAVADDVAAGQTAAEEVASDVATTTGNAVDTVQDVAQDLAAAAAEALTPDVDWQSTFSPDVPYYNLSEAPVTAYTEPNGIEVAGTVAPGGGGFIETCNEALDWCLIPFGDNDETGWVDMTAFGGVAN